jgi:3-hydroxybutyryl-CoA dehydrogenase
MPCELRLRLALEAVVYVVDWLVNQSREPIVSETLGIAGAGAIACGLAAVASKHCPVTLLARSGASAERADGRVSRHCEKLGHEGDITITCDAADLAGCSFVVEAIVEARATKAALWRELEPELRADAVLASTTSSLSVTELAAASGRPERFVGLHVFNPVPKMKLVELAFPQEATAETRARAHALCEYLGKVPVEVPDLPGFVVNRLLFPYLFSAVEFLEESGMDPQDVDTAMTLGAGHPMGPLALLDFIGLDVAEAIGDEIGAPVPDRIRTLVEEGALGKKAGRGLYDY